MTDTHLDTSLTSMEWLNRLSTVNKHLLGPGEGFASNPMVGMGMNMTKAPFNSAYNYAINETAGSIEHMIINRLPENVTLGGTSAMLQYNGTAAAIKSASPTNASHLTAQRAEPNRPVDLNAEYKGGDHNRREGKPPYSYVNLITFAINSNTKKRMTLNEIYEWIADNFHYYRRAGNGWKVIYQQPTLPLVPAVIIKLEIGRICEKYSEFFERKLPNFSSLTMIFQESLLIN